VSLEELKRQSSGFSIFSLPGNHVFWKVAILGATVVFLVDIFRYIFRSKKIYDIFISYKSEDAEVVRKITERLMSSGINVWFAEHEILLTNRWFFQWHINKGIKLSKYVLAFTSDDHAKSRHCNKEINLSLKYQGTDNVIEIVMHEGDLTHKKFPEFKKCSAIKFDDNIDAITEFIQQKTGLEIKPLAAAIKKVDDDYYGADYLGSRYMVNIKEWSFKESNSDGVHLFEYKNFAGKGALLMNFFARRDDERRSLHNQSVDDRELYYKLLIFARKYFIKDMPATPVGVHLFFYKNLSQLGLTYWVKGKYPFWSRKYSIIAEPSTYSFPVEVAFTFSLMSTASYSEFCHYTQVMEETAKSLRWL
jgi:hypothetical protein